MARTTNTVESLPDATPSVTDETEQICPTCGQSLDDPTTAFTWRPVERPWRAWVMVVVGLYLVVVFGPQAWSAFQSLPSPTVQMSCSLAREGGHGTQFDCAQALSNTEEFRRTLVAAAGGAITIVLGVGRIARQRPRGPFSRGRPREAASERWRGRNLMLAAFLPIWTLAEALLVPCFQLLLAVTCFTLIVRLLQGEPPSFDLVNAAIDRTLDAAPAVTGMLSLPLPLP